MTREYDQAPDRSMRAGVAASIDLLLFVVVPVQLAIGFIFHAMDRGPVRSDLFGWHRTLGVAVALLILLSIGLRRRRPVVPADRYEGRAGLLALWSERACLALLIALPVAGLLAVSAYEGLDRIELAGGLSLPIIPGVSDNAGESAEVWHKLLVQLLIWSVALRILAGSIQIAARRRSEAEQEH